MLNTYPKKARDVHFKNVQLAYNNEAFSWCLWIKHTLRRSKSITEQSILVFNNRFHLKYVRKEHNFNSSKNQ